MRSLGHLIWGRKPATRFHGIGDGQAAEDRELARLRHGKIGPEHQRDVEARRRKAIPRPGPSGRIYVVWRGGRDEKTGRVRLCGHGRAPRHSWRSSPPKAPDPTRARTSSRGGTSAHNFLRAPDIRRFLQPNAAQGVELDRVTGLEIGGEPLLRVTGRLSRASAGQFGARNELPTGREQCRQQRGVLLAVGIHGAI